MAEKSRLEKYLPLVIAIVGAISAALGATISHVLTRSSMLEDRLLDMRKSAYSDFFQGQSLLRSASNKDEENEANNLITKAKFNVLLIGSHSTLCSMVNYWDSANKYHGCSDSELRKKDAVIYQKMRREIFISLGVSESPDVEAYVVVPFLWNCSLPGLKLDEACRIH